MIRPVLLFIGLYIILSTWVKGLFFTDSTGYTVQPDDVTLYLYTRENPDVPQKISVSDLSDIASSNFKFSRESYFVIHGIFRNWDDLNPYIRPPLLNDGDVNVFMVDYSGPASSFAIHDKAIVGVGRILADFIYNMEERYLLTGDNFILIGHSMGAHVAGEIGRNLNGSIGTIVAIDPADMIPPNVYIDAKKAKYVQAIHTSIIGLKEPVGHLDFYPNNFLLQPGCFIEPICAHYRGVKFYGESLATGGFTAVKCNNYLDYISGRCDSNQKSHLGGFNLDKSSSGSYYLVTNSHPPYSIS